MSRRVDISVVTPSFNSLAYLRRCCASVRDQSGVTAEHLVMDGGSTDGTREWLAAQGLPHVSEPDGGMYDALNKGLVRCQGQVLGYLNCDEQYLPGALAAVAEVFARRPEVDLVFGDALLVRPDGSLVAFRKAYPLRWPYVLAGHLYALTCTIFFRRGVIDSGLRFDTTYRMVGDADFIVRGLRAGLRSHHLQRYQAAFTVTGDNLSTSTRAREERLRQLAAAPAAIRLFRAPLNALRLGEKWMHGAYRTESPLRYALFTDDPSERTRFEVARPSFRWSWT